MPEIKFQHIISFSSEDKVHKAENLLCQDTFRKWKCCTPGEKQASIVVQLEKSSLIHSIDIGNECSAFVEVLVGRSVDQTQDFKVLLVASSFMSPMESKNCTNINRVRMFGTEKLSSPASTEKWDLVKIVCTQPFNKSIQYGLSFIKLHSPPSPVTSSDHNQPIKKLGSFSMKDDDDDGDLSVGSFFAKRKENLSAASSAAAIRDASSLAAIVLEQSAKESKTLTPSAKLFAKQNSDVKSLYDRTEQKEKSQLNKTQIPRTIVKDTVSDKTTQSRKRKENETNMKAKEPVPKKPKSSPKTKPFNKLLENVVFVLSGFQNPYRSELRDKGMKMGAHYKGDWDKNCTHLVCAFVNTPKYTQVRKAGGRVVAKDWIIDCYNKKSLLPWRDYKLGNYQKDSTTDDSETESSVKSPEKTNVKKHAEHTITKSIIPDIAENSKKTIETSKLDNMKENSTKDVSVLNFDVVNSDDEYAASTDVDGSNSSDSDSGRDTEEVLRKAKHSMEATKKSPSESDHCRPDTTKLPLPELPEFFKNKCFFLYGNFSSEEIHNLERYIIAFNGTVSSYMDKKVNFVITNETWDDMFNDALEENDQLIFVKSQWIYECKEKSKQMPYQRFVVVPTS